MMRYSSIQCRMNGRRYGTIGRWARAVLAGLILAVAGSCPAWAEAVDPPRRLIDYKHSRWTTAEGAPPIIYAITQDQRGYLILGTSVGLYRFDGVSFEEITSRDPDLSQGRILFLLKARDGAIWVFYDVGTIATYRDGVLKKDRSVPPTAPEPAGVVQERDGTIWVLQSGTDRPYLIRRDGKWSRTNMSFDVHDDTGPKDLFTARDGTLWLSTDKGLYARRTDASQFSRVVKISGRTKVSEDRDGQIWISDDRGTRILKSAKTGNAVYPTPAFRRWTAVTQFDRDDNLWIANGDGLFRISQPSLVKAGAAAGPGSAVEGMTSKDGLTADTTTPLFEDREGNIWVGTTRGLDEFRKINIMNEPSLTVASAFGAGLFAAGDGSVYIGAKDALYRVSPHDDPKIVTRPLVEPRFICEVPGGGILAMAGDAFVYMARGKVKRLPVPELLRSATPSFDQRACASNLQGSFWVARGTGDSDSSLYSYSHGSWRFMPLAPEQRLLELMTASNGTPVGFLTSGEIGPLDSRGRITKPWVTGAQLQRRSVKLTALDRFVATTKQGIILAGAYGLVRMDGRTVQIADSRRFPWLAGLTGFVETPEGETWMLGRVGIIRVNTRALDRAFADPHVTVTPKIFDFEDGLPEVRNRTAQTGAVRGGDGRIWFNLVGGVVWVDPAHLARNTLPPPVHIRGLVAGTLRYRDPPATVQLPRGTTSVAITYAGLSFAVPKRMRFRYQLEGVDQAWVDASDRREAFYTNLGAGTYRFHVIAANSDGVWNMRGATIELTIPPTFLQSIWFKLLCAVILALLVWLMIRLRTQALRARMQARFDVQTAERERIARELHDTLLQGVQGLTLIIQTAVAGLPEGSGPRMVIENALDRADTVIGEGRDQVLALRSVAAPDSLVEALGHAARSIVHGPIPTCQISITGTPRPVRPEVSRELLRIAEESLRNTIRHASASKVVICLGFSRQELALTVNDDGRGIEPDVLEKGRQGHYGLVGMRERAKQLHGRLEIATNPESGTDVRLTVPARIAYEDHRQGMWSRFSAIWRGRSLADL